jgi:uncharacterized YccA/Bax inhibitor family protein
VPTSNPVLTDKALQRALQPAPDTISPWPPVGGAPVDGSLAATPPLARTDVEAMTTGGVVSATALLLVVLGIAGGFGWASVEPDPLEVRLPGWIFLAALGALGIAILTVFKAEWARFTSPLYAALQGLAVGAISRVYEIEYDGIVLNAVLASVAVFAVMLTIYALRIIRVTDKLRFGIIGATLAICVVYLFGLIVRLFGGDIGFIHDGGAIGILFSLAVVGVAAFNLLLDFDLSERLTAAGAPKRMEWYVAFGILVTLVWLYLEMLRLLSKLRR